MPKTESESGKQSQGIERWADEITPAGLLALEARV